MASHGFLSCFLLALLLGVLDMTALVAMARPLGAVEPPLPGDAAGPTVPGGTAGRRDRSMAGAEVILGGFATVALAVIFCYIRVTRKNSGGDKA